jgi:hypothetical protein
MPIELVVECCINRTQFPCERDLIMPRYTDRMEVEIWADATEGCVISQKVQAREVSLDGFCLYSDDPIDVAERFRFRFETPGRSMPRKNCTTGVAEIVRRDQFAIGDRDYFCLEARIVHRCEVLRVF